jgi:hypothetical protein
LIHPEEKKKREIYNCVNKTNNKDIALQKSRQEKTKHQSQTKDLLGCSFSVVF